MEFHIIGGGIAGLVTASALADGKNQVHLWEKENLPCSFSSSKNAAIFRSYESDPVLSILVKDSYRNLCEYESPQTPFLERLGLLIDPLEQDYYENSWLQSNPTFDGIKSKKHTFTLPGQKAFSGFFIPQNGIIDIHALQDYFFRKAKKNKAIFHFNHLINELNIENGQITGFISNGLKTNIPAESVIINAAGSWAGEIIAKNGFMPPPIAPYKRHLFLIRPNKTKKDQTDDHVNGQGIPTKEWPVLWNERRDIYIRPEGDGFLGTHCDQRETQAGDYAPDEKEVHRFLESALSVFPFLSDYHISRYWACLRTFSLDQHPVIGYDHQIKNLFWVAGLGGRGMTMAAGLESVIRDEVLKTSGQQYNPFSPERFF